LVPVHEKLRLGAQFKQNVSSSVYTLLEVTHKRELLWQI